MSHRSIGHFTQRMFLICMDSCIYSAMVNAHFSLEDEKIRTSSIENSPHPTVHLPRRDRALLLRLHQPVSLSANISKYICASAQIYLCEDIFMLMNLNIWMNGWKYHIDGFVQISGRTMEYLLLGCQHRKLKIHLNLNFSKCSCSVFNRPLTSSMLQLFALAKFCLMAAMKEWWLKKPDSQKEVGRPACKTKRAGQAQKQADYLKQGST